MNLDRALLNNLFMVVIIAVLILFMWLSTRKQRKRQQEQEDWLNNLQPGDEVATIGGIIGTVVEADIAHDQVVIDSEGTKLRMRVQSIRQAPVVPHYADEDAPSEDSQNSENLEEQAAHATEPNQADEASKQEPVEANEKLTSEDYKNE